MSPANTGLQQHGRSLLLQGMNGWLETGSWKWQRRGREDCDGSCGVVGPALPSFHWRGRACALGGRREAAPVPAWRKAWQVCRQRGGQPQRHVQPGVALLLTRRVGCACRSLPQLDLHGVVETDLRRVYDRAIILPIRRGSAHTQLRTRSLDTSDDRDECAAGAWRELVALDAERDAISCRHARL